MKLVKSFKKNILEPTVNLIFDITKTVNSLDDWFRGKRTAEFVGAITEKLTSDMGIKDSYENDYVKIFKATKA